MKIKLISYVVYAFVLFPVALVSETPPGQAYSNSHSDTNPTFSPANPDWVQSGYPQSVTAAAFPFYDGFETGTLGSEWMVYTTNNGRVQVDSSYPYAGAYSLLLDDSVSDTTFSTAAAILTVDLSGQTQVELDYWWDEFGTLDGTSDGVFISADDGANWYRIQSFDDDPTAWRHQVLDLDAAAAANGLTFNNHFQIKFQFSDDDPIPVDGYSIDEVQVRPNATPILSWPGDTNYEQDGLHPESGNIYDSYVYRVQYNDYDNNQPNYVRVHIQKGGVDVDESPFPLTCVGEDYQEGVICNYTKTGLEASTDYTYWFEAQDDQGLLAAQTQAIDGPDVIHIYRLFVPVIMLNAGPPEGAPVLNPISNPGGHYSYTVSWSAVNRATNYVLEEDDNQDFTSPITVYNGPNTSRAVSAPAVGTFYYRVRATNNIGSSEWSNTQPVVVTVTPPNCPTFGNWTGSGSRFSINFRVVRYGSGCQIQSVTGHLTATCHIPMDGTWTMGVDYILTSAMIQNFHFSTSNIYEDTHVSGDFGTLTIVNGTWSYYYYEAWNNSTCRGSGSWTGSYTP